MNSRINLTKGDEIQLSVSIGVETPNWFDVLQITEKAILLKTDKGKSVWLPKTSIDWDGSWQCFFLKDWFRKGMNVLQLNTLKN